MLWFFGKLFAFLFVFIWLRGTLPRMRYDQFMRFGWKVLIPVSIAWILIVSTARYLRSAGAVNTQSLLFAAGVVLVVGLGISYILELRAKRIAAQMELDVQEQANKPFDPFAGGFPVPPLPGQQPIPSRHKTLTVTAPGEGN